MPRETRRRTSRKAGSAGSPATHASSPAERRKLADELAAGRDELAAIRRSLENLRERLITLFRKRQELREAVERGADLAVLRRRFHLLAAMLDTVPRPTDPEVVASAELFSQATKMSRGNPSPRPLYPLVEEIVAVLADDPGMAAKDVFKGLRQREGRELIVSAPPKGPVRWMDPSSGKEKSTTWATIEDHISKARKILRDQAKHRSTSK